MMNIKKLISASMVAVALSGCQREAVKPNVLFILVDDMQADAIAALGNRDTYTPNIDRLINEGVVFKELIPMELCVELYPCLVVLCYLPEGECSKCRVME